MVIMVDSFMKNSSCKKYVSIMYFFISLSLIYYFSTITYGHIFDQLLFVDMHVITTWRSGKGDQVTLSNQG